MNIRDFVSDYKNHPVLFIGTGMSLRYLKKSYTWDKLLEKISTDLKGNSEYYLDLKYRCTADGEVNYEKIATFLEDEFNQSLTVDRNGLFKRINDIFYEKMTQNISASRFKIYISELFADNSFKENKEEEIAELKKIRKNIGSIITTNYDEAIENLFNFTPLIGNNILLSNPYGAVYKIHGCVSDFTQIIITENDYNNFGKKYDLIRAQLLSLFIHNPIIFLGYSITDSNIKKILRTIFTYVEPNTELAEKIRKNFLLVEYLDGSDNEEINEHDIDVQDFSLIRINKIKTDNFIQIYKSLSDLHLPISALDVRKVQSIVKEIYSGGDKIKVHITEDWDSLNNNDKILAIGSEKTISYEFQTSSEMMENYFNIIDESNSQLLALIDKLRIQTSQYFPVYGFGLVNPNLSTYESLREIQESKLRDALLNPHSSIETEHDTIEQIIEDENISMSNKTNAILWNVMNDKISLEDIEHHLRNYPNDKRNTNYRKLLCAYDKKKYEDLRDWE